MVLWVVLVVVVVAAAVLAARRVRVVPSGHVGVVLRGGRYARLVTPGLLWLGRGEQVRAVATTTQTVGAEVALGDGLLARLRVEYRVDDPVRYLGAVADAPYAVERDGVAALRDFASRTAPDALAASNVAAAEAVRATLAPTVGGWGLALLRVEVVVGG